MKKENYVVRKWLNPKKSSYSGSVVAFFGQSAYNKKDGKHASLEIADCRSKVYLHSGSFGKEKDINKFIKKLKRLRKVIYDFIVHLESQI